MLSVTKYAPPEEGDLDDVEDLRIHGLQYAMTGENVMKACLPAHSDGAPIRRAGLRREQRFGNGRHDHLG